MKILLPEDCGYDNFEQAGATVAIHQGELSGQSGKHLQNAPDALLPETLFQRVQALQPAPVNHALRNRVLEGFQRLEDIVCMSGSPETRESRRKGLVWRPAIHQDGFGLSEPGAPTYGYIIAGLGYPMVMLTHPIQTRVMLEAYLMYGGVIPNVTTLAFAYMLARLDMGIHMGIQRVLNIDDVLHGMDEECCVPLREGLMFQHPSFDATVLGLLRIPVL